jgi:hypothetical protein
MPRHAHNALRAHQNAILDIGLRTMAKDSLVHDAMVLMLISCRAHFARSLPVISTRALFSVDLSV